MGIWDRPGVARLTEFAEERLGVAIRPAEQLQRYAVMESEFGELAGEAEDLALHAMGYFEGRPTELSNERRKRIAQRSRVALKFDPLAGAEAQLLADFAFGKGVPKPTARDEDVQQVIDEAWTDANNEEKLTGFQAQRKLSNELLTSGELFHTLYTAGGKVRVGRLDPDTVEAIVPDPEDRLRPLWYMARQRRFRWDFENDRASIEDELTENGRPKIRYWKHWRNYDDAVAEREMGLVDDDEEDLLTPPAEKVAKGVIYHVAINQTGEELRGNPPWARSLRFFHAMNVLTESHVAMAQAQASFIAQRVVDGTPKQVTKAAASILSHVSELGSSSRFTGPGSPEGQAAFAPGAQAPPAPGSWWTGNGGDRMEALNLRSGAGEMQVSGQIVRAPIAAAAGFGQHYLGDAGNANLATASTLELPATMRIESWQDYHRQYLVWFTDRAIEAAVKAGRLGGLDGFPEEGPMGEMKLHEAEDRAAMERRTGKDLSYEFVMPFPGRRQLADVVTAVQGVATTMDPNGVSIALRRHLLRFFFEQIGVADVAHAVEECIPDKPVPGGIGPQPQQQIDPATGQPIPAPATGPGAPNPGSSNSTGDRPANVKKGTQGTDTQEAWVPEDLRALLGEFSDQGDELFRRLVSEPALTATLALTNGAGKQ